MSDEPKIVYGRLHSDPKYGDWFVVQSHRQHYEMRLTPSGLIRLGEVKSGRHPAFKASDAMKEVSR